MDTYSKDIQFDLIVPAVKVLSHKQAILTMAQNAADFLNISEKSLYQKIMEKEQFSASSVGNGIAIPNLKMRRLQSSFTMLMTLENEITYETPDDEAIEIYVLLLSPQKEGPIHLRQLSRLSRFLKNTKLRNRIRETKDPDTIRSLLMDPEGWLLVA